MCPILRGRQLCIGTEIASGLFPTNYGPTVPKRKWDMITIIYKCCWVQDGVWSDQSCPFPNLNSSVRAERLFAIRYLNVVIKPLCGNLDICPNYKANAYFQSRNSVPVLSVADRNRKWMMFFWIALFGPTLAQSNRFCDRSPFRSRKTRANAPSIGWKKRCFAGFSFALNRGVASVPLSLRNNAASVSWQDCIL